ncbi:MAG: hypothetical protein JKY90_07750 [Gammaproteobacteria bacterium]|nr:hypothetical protein [Gammaproteobacteria bacterium]
MMYKQILSACVIVFSTLACANSDADSAANTGQETNQVLRSNADGERILIRSAIDTTAYREVEVGQACGTDDENGIQLICHANASCIGTSDAEAGMCVAGPRANKTN